MATSASLRAASLAASVWSRGVVDHLGYTSPPTRVSTIPRLVRFEVASTAFKSVLPRYGSLSLTL